MAKKKLVDVFKPLAPPKPLEQMTEDDWRELGEREWDEQIAPALRKAGIEPKQD